MKIISRPVPILVSLLVVNNYVGVTELRLGLHSGLAGISDEMDGAPVAEGDGRSDDRAHDVHVRVRRAGAAFPVSLLQLSVIAEERGDQDGDDDAHGQQDEKGGKARGRQADAVDDFLADLALEDGDARDVALAGRVAVQRESQIDGRDNFVADFDADVRTTDVAFVDSVRTLWPALDAFLPVATDLIFANILNVNEPI